MKQIWANFLLLFFSLNAFSEPVPLPAAPKLAARSWILVDHNSNHVLAEYEADKKIEPASITKIMTSYVVYKALRDGIIDTNDRVQISEKAWRMKGSRMFIEVGREVPLGDLIKGLVIQSGNDAAVALAEHVAGTEDAFVDQMNITARSLGMENTQFQNATGWPTDGHYTTARDISLLSSNLIRDFPEHYALNSQKEYEFNNIIQSNRNRLLWRDDSVDGIKTGHTDAAGYCLAASARRGDMRLISVVMGADSENARVKYSQTLLNYGFRYYESHKLYSRKEMLQEVRVWKGDSEALTLGPRDDVYVAIPRGQYSKLKSSLEGVPVPLEAPIQQGVQLGTIEVTLHDKVLAQIPAVALEQIGEGSFISKMADTLLLLFE